MPINERFREEERGGMEQEQLLNTLVILFENVANASTGKIEIYVGGEDNEWIVYKADREDQVLRIVRLHGHLRNEEYSVTDTTEYITVVYSRAEKGGYEVKEIVDEKPDKNEGNLNKFRYLYNRRSEDHQKMSASDKAGLQHLLYPVPYRR